MDESLVVEVTAPSRLHFGLLRVGSGKRRFGGAGVMIEQPSLRMTARRQNRFGCAGDQAGRIEQFASHWQAYYDVALPKVELRYEEGPPAHCGLGSGTQLGMTVAAVLNATVGREGVGAIELATSVGRGERSAIGTHGFVLGGLLVDAGKDANQRIAPLECRLAVPEAWRFVLIRPSLAEGLSGDLERNAFASIPKDDPQRARLLESELQQRMLPALERADFASFSDSLFRFGYEAGMNFSSCQGGPYNGPQLEAIVDAVRNQGVRGVGQSSWGPTLFALLPTSDEARAFIEAMRSQLAPNTSFLSVAANNRGATLQQTRRETSQSLSSTTRGTVS